MDSEFACPLCGHISRSIKHYVNHYHFHCNEYRRIYECPFRGCKRNLSSYAGLRAHVYREHEGNFMKRNHEKIFARNIGIQLQCKTGMCQQICNGTQDLLNHLRNHIDEDTSVECPFDQCSKTYLKKKSLSAHTSRYHRYHTAKQLPFEVTCSANLDFCNDMAPNIEDSSLIANDIFYCEEAHDQVSQIQDSRC